jgi:hypothetical protein
MCLALQPQAGLPQHDCGFVDTIESFKRADALGNAVPWSRTVMEISHSLWWRLSLAAAGIAIWRRYRSDSTLVQQWRIDAGN